MKKKIITVCAAVLFLTALGLTLYPLISNYVNQKYASEIQTAYQVLIQQTDESVLQLLSEKKAIYVITKRPETRCVLCKLPRQMWIGFWERTHFLWRENPKKMDVKRP